MMRRLSRRQACEALGWSTSRFAEQCRNGYFLSAQQDRPRKGWSVGECCVLAEKNRERPCGVCAAGETPNAEERLVHIRLESIESDGGAAVMLTAESSERLLQFLGEVCGEDFRRDVASMTGSVSIELRLNSLTAAELRALCEPADENVECAA